MLLYFVPHLITDMRALDCIVNSRFVVSSLQRNNFIGVGWIIAIVFIPDEPSASSTFSSTSPLLEPHLHIT